jgi:hypothetical protein
MNPKIIRDFLTTDHLWWFHHLWPASHEPLSLHRDSRFSKAGIGSAAITYEAGDVENNPVKIRPTQANSAA